MLGTLGTGGHTEDATPYGPKGTRSIGEEALLHAPFSAGEVAHLYHIQRALFQGGADQAWLLTILYKDIVYWRSLANGGPFHTSG